MPEGPACFQAIRQLATVNWGGTNELIASFAKGPNLL
jgi:hypothetical protein